MIVSRDDNAPDKSPYDDSVSRDAFQRYADAHEWVVRPQSQYAHIDIYVAPPGKSQIAIELQCNSCWTTQTEYPQDIHIPLRKFPYFQEALTPPEHHNSWEELMPVDRGYFMLFNVAHTKVAILKFSALLDGLKNKLFTTQKLRLNGEMCEVALVPVAYIVKYIDIPI